MPLTRFEFDWDPAKAAANVVKHGVAFGQAMTDFMTLWRCRASTTTIAMPSRAGLRSERPATGGFWSSRNGSQSGSFRPVARPDARCGNTAREPSHEDEYDFSGAERGKFFRRDAQFIPPVHLDPEVLSYLAARAEARGTSLNDLINELLKKDIERMEAAR